MSFLLSSFLPVLRERDDSAACSHATPFKCPGIDPANINSVTTSLEMVVSLFGSNSASTGADVSCSSMCSNAASCLFDRRVVQRVSSSLENSQFWPLDCIHVY